MKIAIRTRIALGVAVPALLLIAAFVAIVFVRVRHDRLQDLDRSLAERAAALAAQVEREDDHWEADFSESATGAPSAEIVGRLIAWEIREPNGAVLWRSTASLPARRPSVREWTGTLIARGDEQPRIQVHVAESLAPLARDLNRLLQTLALAAGLLGAVAILAARVVSARVVEPLARIASKAAGVSKPTADAPLPVSGTGDEIDQLARTLNDAFARIHIAWQRQARFTADASHELRTPLAVMKTEAEVALRKERTPDEYRASLAAVGQAADRMHNLVDSLLLLARADADAPLEQPPLDFALLTSQVVRELAAPPSVAVRVHAETPVMVRGDERHLAILVRNLVANALRHTSAGTVDVHVRALASCAELSVVDTGEGMPPDVVAHVFERFYRADAARSRDTGGAGLGLSIVRAIADAHGGTASVTSELGRGSAFVVRLPNFTPASADLQHPSLR
jgi:signal transduction histidine kinase